MRARAKWREAYLERDGGCRGGGAGWELVNLYFVGWFRFNRKRNRESSLSAFSG